MPSTTRRRQQLFLSTSPLRGTTLTAIRQLDDILLFLSTSPLRGTTIDDLPDTATLQISIHVPLAGDDRTLFHGPSHRGWISIHVPLAGDDWSGP